MNAIDVSSVPYDIFNTQFVSSNMESSDDDSSFHQTVVLLIGTNGSTNMSVA